jgi:argininosuccinate synthase
MDLTDEFVEDYIFPTLKAGAKYENTYLLGTSFARPPIGKRLVEIAKKEGADAICHGCTGKGNDQVRFELAVKAFAPEIDIIAPWRIWDIKSREEEIAYAEAHNVPLRINRETNYSKDKNLWHLSHEGLDLEDPANEPQYNKPGFLELGVSPEQAPDEPTYLTLTFEKGIPVALNGEKMKGAQLIAALNAVGGANGVGIIDIVENRLVGMKSRGVYETPGGAILYFAHEQLEMLCLDKETQHYKQLVAQKFADLVYNGQWYTPLREALSAFVDATQKTVTGEVKLKLYKGNIIPAGTTSPYSLYSEELATFGEDGVYNQGDAAGFINLFGLPLTVQAKLAQKLEKEAAKE